MEEVDGAPESAAKPKGVLSWVGKNPSIPFSCVAIVVSIFALIQSHRSADIAATQLKLASRPLLYGTCNFARVDFLKLSPIPDALLIAEPVSVNPPLQIQTLTKPLPIVPPYETVLPWIVDKCSITNTGKGIAQSIEFTLTTMFVNTKTELATSGKMKQTVSIPFLSPGGSYNFVVGNQRDDTALILMPQTIRYQVGLTGEAVSEPLIHDDQWNQLTLDNMKRPRNRR